MKYFQNQEFTEKDFYRIWLGPNPDKETLAYAKRLRQIERGATKADVRTASAWGLIVVLVPLFLLIIATAMAQ